MKDLGEFAKKYGVVVALIVTLVGWGATWGSMKATVEDQGKDIIKLESENKELKTELRSNYKELKNNVVQNTEGLAIVGHILELD